MRLIDADALIPKLNSIHKAETQIFGNASWYFAKKCINAVEDAPIIEEQKTGKWIKKSEYVGDDISCTVVPHWSCSICGKEAIINDWYIYELSNFCPHCGAKMTGGDEE